MTREKVLEEVNKVQNKVDHLLKYYTKNGESISRNNLDVRFHIFPEKVPDVLVLINTNQKIKAGECMQTNICLTLSNEQKKSWDSKIPITLLEDLFTKEYKLTWFDFNAIERGRIPERLEMHIPKNLENWKVLSTVSVV